MMRVLHFLSFLIFYIKEVVVSNVRVASDVLKPKYAMDPGIISVDVEGMTDRQLLLMANFITMTPGTLGISFSEDASKLYIHAMYLDGDADALSADLVKTYGKRVRDVF